MFPDLSIASLHAISSPLISCEVMNAYLYESRKDMHNYGQYYISMIYSKIISSKTLTIAVLFDVGNFLSAHFRPVLPFRTPQTGSGKSEVF